MFGFLRKKSKAKAENDDAIIETVVNQMDQSMSKKVFYGGSEEARSILKSVRSILYSGTSSSAEQYSNTVFFYTEVWVRTHGGFRPEFSEIAYIRNAMKKKYSEYSTNSVDRALNQCLDYIFKNEPGIKEKIGLFNIVKEKAPSHEEKAAMNGMLARTCAEFEKYISANATAQNQNLDDPEYGLVVNKPIYVQGINGSKMYLSNLKSSLGENLIWNRRV